MKYKSAIVPVLLLSTTVFAVDICVSPNDSIPDNGSAAVVPIFISATDNEVIDTVSLDLILNHEWVGDLHIQLRSPSGTIITLIDRPGLPSSGFPGPFGCGGHDIVCTFTDIAVIPAESVCSTTDSPVIAGFVIPSQPMETFHGEIVEGTWELIVNDMSPYDSGEIVQVCLTITTNTLCTADLNNDGDLNFFDVSAFLSAFSNNDPIADFNNDGDYNFFDISVFLAAFTTGC